MMNAALYYTFLVYFITHIPITLLVDFQVIFGEFYPPGLRAIERFYIETFHDILIRTKPVWFKSFIWLEAVLQVPFFFYVSWGLVTKRDKIRIPCIMYGAHVATTVWPILAEIIFTNELLSAQKMILLSFYLPYFLIPLVLMLYMAHHERPFTSDATKAKAT